MSTIIDKFKEEQREEEVGMLEAVVHAKLEAAMMELDLLRRTVRLDNDESGQVVTASFQEYVARLGIDVELSRESFLREMGEAFDAVLENSIVEEPEEETVSDKGSTDGGPAPVVVS
jgi:hypothetical protein